MAIRRPDGSHIPLGNKPRGRGGFTPRQAAAPHGFQGIAGRFAPFTGSGRGSTARGFQPAQRQTQAGGSFAYVPQAADAPTLVAPALRAVPLGQLVRQVARPNRRGRGAQAQGPAKAQRPSMLAIKAQILSAKRRRR